MKRGLILISLLLVLLTLLILVVRNRDPFGKGNSMFAIDWSGEVRVIQIKEGESLLTLRKIEGEDWMVNDSFVARPSAIAFILATLENLEIKSPVSDELFSDIVTKYEINPVEVKVTDGRRRVLKFLIYQNPQLSYGSIMTRSEGSKPFFVYLPGYDTDPGYHFVVDEQFWMPHNMFNLQPETISSISVDYRDISMTDINIDISSDNLRLRFDDKDVKMFDTTQVKRYISYFTFVPVESWVTDIDHGFKRELLESEPEIEFDVTLRDGSSIVARLWIKSIETPEGNIPDTDRLYGTLNGSNDLYIVRYFDIDPLIKTSDYFIKH